MGTHYTPAGSYQTVRVQSQTSVVDVELIGIYTKPSGVYIGVPVPLAAFQADTYDTFLETTGDLIEGILAAPGPDGNQDFVVGVSYVQDIDAAGLLSAFLDFTVAYTPTGTYQGTFSQIVRLPVTSFESAEAYNTKVNGEYPQVAIDNAYLRLKKLAHS